MSILDIKKFRSNAGVLAEGSERIQNVRRSQSAYVAALIDSLRIQNESLLLYSLEKLQELKTPKFPILSISAHAALLALGAVTAAQFERAFLKSAQSGEAKSVADWFAENPRFIEALKLSSLPHKAWKTCFPRSYGKN